jgi:hypothetical protein
MLNIHLNYNKRYQNMKTSLTNTSFYYFSQVFNLNLYSIVFYHTKIHQFFAEIPAITSFCRGCKNCEDEQDGMDIHEMNFHCFITFMKYF